MNIQTIRQMIRIVEVMHPMNRIVQISMAKETMIIRGTQILAQSTTSSGKPSPIQNQVQNQCLS